MALADALHGLLRLPGATYSCVVERDTGRVLAEAGHGESGAGDGEGVVPYSVARWGTAVAAMFDSTSGDGLDDVMITGRRSYHLVRPLGTTAAVLVYLRLDRARSNLAAARRELAGVRWGSGGEAGAGHAEASGVSRSGSHDRAVRAAARPRRPGDDVAAPRASPGGAPVRVLAPPDGSSRSLPVASAQDSAPGPPRPAAEPLPQATRPQSGPQTARPQPGPQMPAPQTPAPQAPRPQIPLPRRAPGGRPSDPGARRRGAARPSGSDESAAPDGFVVPAVLGQSWAHDPGTLRRLIAGLRRMP